jgi:hypothetical protein
VTRHTREEELGPGDHELIVFAWGEGAFKQMVRQTVNLGVNAGQEQPL